MSAIEQVARGVAALHVGMAVMLKSPELELSEIEARKLSEAGLNAAAWIMPVEFVAGPGAAFAALAWTAGLIYVPRVVQIARRKNQAPVKSAPMTNSPQSNENVEKAMDEFRATQPPNLN